MREYTIKRITGAPNWNKVPQLQVDNHLWHNDPGIIRET